MVYSEISKENMFDGLNITPDQIYQLKEYFSHMESNLNEAKDIYGSAKEDAYKMRKYMSGSSFGRVMEDCSRYGSRIARIIESKGLNSYSMDEIDKVMYEAFEMMAKDMDFTDSYALKFKAYDANNIRKSLYLTAYCCFLEMMIETIMSILLGPIISSILGTVVIAPIVEESAKRISTVGGYPAEFAIVFNSFEFTLYVVNYNEISKIVAVRLVCVGVHLVNFVINWFVNNTKLQEKLGMNRDRDKEEVTNTGFLLGIFIHSIWNAGFSNVVLSVLGLID